jgi:hypothetical protein
MVVSEVIYLISLYHVQQQPKSDIQTKLSFGSD